MSQTINGRPVESYHNCGCGCEVPVNSPKSTFRPGHDQKWVGEMANLIVLARLTDNSATELGLSASLKLKSGALQAKVWNKVNKDLAKGVKKAKRNKAAIDSFDAEYGIRANNSFQGDELVAQEVVKIGRWTYPLSHDAQGFPVRNTKRDGTGEWVALELPARIEVAA